MTREEAIICLQGLLENPLINKCSFLAQAIEMSIKALEQEPCGDAISRQAVEDVLYDYSRSCDFNFAQIMEYIDKLPSVNPQEPITDR